MRKTTIPSPRRSKHQRREEYFKDKAWREYSQAHLKKFGFRPAR